MLRFSGLLLAVSVALCGCNSTNPNLAPVIFQAPSRPYPPVTLVVNDGHVRVFTEIVMSGYVGHAYHEVDPVPQAIFDQFVESALFEAVLNDPVATGLRIDLDISENVVQTSGEKAGALLSAATIGIIPSTSTLSYTMTVAITDNESVLKVFNYELAAPKVESLVGSMSEAKYEMELTMVRHLVSRFLADLVDSGLFDNGMDPLNELSRDEI